MTVDELRKALEAVDGNTEVVLLHPLGGIEKADRAEVADWEAWDCGRSREAVGGSAVLLIS